VIANLGPGYLARLALPGTRADLVPADAAGESGSVVGGGAVRVTLRFEPGTHAPSRRIREARVRVLASTAGHGPAAVLLERVEGALEGDARRLTPRDLLAPLGVGPPAAVARAAVWLLDALARALDDGADAARTGAPGVLVCRCLGVGDREIRRAVRRGAETVPAIGLDCAAGTGCHSCWPDLRTILDEESAPPSAGPARPHPSDLAFVVAALVAPIWRAQGIPLRGVRVEGELVSLRSGPSAPDALASPIGALALARHALRDALSETVRVELDAAG
jgi:bacterioferritin-associated ferredoxin